MSEEIDKLIEKMAEITEDKDSSIKAMKEAWSSLFQEEK